MILSDQSIRAAMSQAYPVGERLLIDPWPDDIHFQPASVELTLAPEIVYLVNLDEQGEPVYIRTSFKEEGTIILPPTSFVLGCTNETVSIPNWLIGQLTGKSSLARRGLSIHATAGFIDPGFSGRITLELKNDSGIPVTLTKHMRIGQLVLTATSLPALRPYGHPELGSHYQGQYRTTTSAEKM